MMKVARFHGFGGPDVLQVERVDLPQPGRGEVAIAVHVCGLNHIDVDIREGISRLPIELPHTPGGDISGEIEAIGPGVDGDWALGDRVVVFDHASVGDGRGGLAERVIWPAARLVRLPPGLSHEAAAAAGITFATAHNTLLRRGRLSAGETVLVHSVSAGVGLAAAQVAKHHGARVIGTTSSADKIARLGGLELDAVLDYTRDDVAAEVRRLTGGRGADLVFDHLGGEAFGVGLAALKPRGRVVVIGGHAGEVVPLDLVALFREEKEIIGATRFERDDLVAVLGEVATGGLRPIIHRTFSLDEARAAMEELESRRHVGKVLVSCTSASGS
ncbi:zinc-binding dehydrogenase [Acrocarpospora pleiomorpha]|nr:zinc-binding dehydrogenase [Acrocarpospora pleiomorpha]